MAGIVTGIGLWQHERASNLVTRVLIDRWEETRRAMP